MQSLQQPAVPATVAMGVLQLFVCSALLIAAVSAVPAHDRYTWIPDSEGKMHLIDLMQTEDEDAPMPYFSGEKDVTLSLYTQNNPTKAQEILVSKPNGFPNFNPQHPTRFIIHGWTYSGKRFDFFREAYMATRSDFNVVIVDWQRPAAMEYSISKRNSRRVGEYLAEVIGYLEANKGLNLDNLSIIGHSLGGQAAGVAGNRLGGRVAKIVGLDPALPLFLTTSLKDRLDPSDGKFVQCIHTNGGTLGWSSSTADADFFPNGGSTQAGCALDLTGTCSHLRAPSFYAESITSNTFVAAQCGSYSSYKKGSCRNNHHDVMGEWTSTSTRGDYYLKTNSKSPYGQGETGL